MVTLSTPASTRLAVEASAASIRIRTLWPAKLEMLAEPTVHDPSTSAAAPTRLSTVCVVDPTMRTRRKSALDELLPCARYQDSDSVSVPVDGSVITGDRIEVLPPSTSNAPALDPASRPVTRSLVPLTVVPSCLAPLEVVGSGSPRSHSPVVAVSVPLGFGVHPVAVSKLSE